MKRCDPDNLYYKSHTSFMVLFCVCACIAHNGAQAAPIVTLTYTNDATFTVPDGINSVTIKSWGAGAGGGGGGTGSGAAGGAGGYAQGTFSVSAGESLDVSVGGGGGGGLKLDLGPTGEGGGGGALSSVSNSTTTILLVVAAGGGGGGGGDNGSYNGGAGGAGGGVSGIAGNNGAGATDGGNGGTASAGGTGGTNCALGTAGVAFQGGAGGDSGGAPGAENGGAVSGGDGGSQTYNPAGGGGGGGYYGGGGGSGANAVNLAGAGGGGGASYVESSASGASNLGGSGRTPTNTAVAEYVAGKGVGGLGGAAGSNGSSGGDGLVVISYEEPATWLGWTDTDTTNITYNSAWAVANVATSTTETVLVWDTSDKGTGSTNDWAYRLGLGAKSAGSVTAQMTGLSKNAGYVWRFYGLNATTSRWSSAVNFSTSTTNTVTLNVVADTYILSGSPTFKGDSDPDDELIVGYSPSGHHRVLVRFNTSGISFPNNAELEVTSAVLKVINRDANGAGNPDVTVFDYAFDFVESNATWNDPDGDGASGTGDTVAGGNYGIELTALTGVNDDLNVSHTFPSTSALKSAVESAITGDNTINLLIKRPTENTTQQYTRFRDRDYASGYFQLTVTYVITLPPAGTMFLFE